MQSSNDTGPGLVGGAALYGDLTPDQAASLSASQGGATDHANTTTVGASPVTKPSGSLPVVPASPTPFTIHITWDSSVNSAPAAFTTDVIAAVRYLETQFSNPVTINIDVGYGEVAGQPLGSGALGESESYLDPVSYTLLRGSLAADATSATNASVVASLPATSPLAVANYWVAQSQAKALGLIPANTTSVDGYVGFAPAVDFTFGDNASGGPVAAGTYDFFATAVHEFTEDMGRIMLTGGSIGQTRNSYSLLDLLHYSGPGVRDFSASTPGYFSVNGGVTNLGQFNTIASGDAGDWATSVVDNPFDAFASPGVPEVVTANDLTEINALGWNATGAPAPPAPAIPPTPVFHPASPGVPVNEPLAENPTGLSITPETHFLMLGDGDAGWLGGSPLAQVSDAGAPVGDSISYTLGGWGAGSFDLTAAGELLTGDGGLPGGPGGRIYALTVTAADETAAGNPSVSSALNVVVGDQGGDVINLASLAGIAASAPTLIYGSGGSDTIDGTGMTGTLFFDGGAGANTMTGGSGVNVYEYGSASDSTSSAMDIITNFNVSVDLIDMTGLATPFSGVAALASGATALGADSIGWQTVGGDTFVYANTHAQAEALSATDMTIDLRGNAALTANNFTYV